MKRMRAPQTATFSYTVGTCTLGYVLVATVSLEIQAILLGDSTRDLVGSLQLRLPGLNLQRLVAQPSPQLALVQQLIEQPQRRGNLLLAPQGTPFQRSVWRALQSIAPGQTVSYGALARRLGMPLAVRAVAQACGQNPVAVAVPCHRVVRSDGGLGGYRWGLWRKQRLLTREHEAFCNGADCA
jgi:AraC family transcriptional regulator of adaptative response/methylated-DNA-[protein]-cysteine methyltransferase